MKRRSHVSAKCDRLPYMVSRTRTEEGTKRRLMYWRITWTKPVLIAFTTTKLSGTPKLLRIWKMMGPLMPLQTLRSSWNFLATLEKLDLCIARWPFVSRSLPLSRSPSKSSEAFCLESTSAEVRMVAKPIGRMHYSLEHAGVMEMKMESLRQKILKFCRWKYPRRDFQIIGKPTWKRKSLIFSQLNLVKISHGHSPWDWSPGMACQLHQPKLRTETMTYISWNTELVCAILQVLVWTIYMCHMDPTFRLHQCV